MAAVGIEKKAKRQRRNNLKRKPMAEINVTPFVDVMLVLLVIFMVAAPLMTAGIPIDLPKTSAKPMTNLQDEPISITISEGGDLFLDEDPISLSEMIPRLSSMTSDETSQRVYIRADGDVAYGEVMQVMGELNSAGFTEVGLVTESAPASIPDS